MSKIAKCLKEDGYQAAHKEWITELRKRNDETENRNNTKMVENTSDGYLNPLKVLQTLDKVNFFVNLFLNKNFRFFQQIQSLSVMEEILLEVPRILYALADL